MLFAYTYVPHQMEKMQSYIDFIFYEVWCKAPGNGAFGLELFDGNAELKEILEAFYYVSTQGGEWFYLHVERIFGLFASLNEAEIAQLEQWYHANNDIENICANNHTCQVARYEDIKAIHPQLRDQLASFFKGLYSQSLLGLAAIRDKIGDIDDHYQAFMHANNTGKCPFCGIGDMKGMHHSRREAYDHYLPKALYPFNSINFHNLAPACHECNSTYKLSRDPAHNAAGRRKAFYPYSTKGQAIELTIDFLAPDIDRVSPDDIQLSFGPAALNEEIEAWKEVYSIDERYRAKCCSSDAKDWLEQVRIMRDIGIDPGSSLSIMQQEAKKYPFANSNFLKKAFLEGCQRIGILDEIKNTAYNDLNRTTGTCSVTG